MLLRQTSIVEFQVPGYPPQARVRTDILLARALHARPEEMLTGHATGASGTGPRATR